MVKSVGISVIKLAAIGGAVLLLAGCGGGAGGTRPALGSPAAIPLVGGLDRVMGKDAAHLTQLFGSPQLDVTEGSARKLQFGNATCVLDTYLYPKGSAAPIVTYIDTRQADGSPIDRASCVGALAAGRRK